ncbi:MAG: type I-E CRISPR-associated protein Cas7/Cse4/CasC [Candidatus Kapaibacterium sp.]
MKIELHMLQSFPPSNLNRDDSGMPKDCEFGGFRRARISSQCLKRSIRYSDQFKKRIDSNIGTRTKYSLGNFKKELLKTDIEEDKAQVIAKIVLEQVIGKIDEDNKTSVLYYTDDKELANLASIANEYSDQIFELNKLISLQKKAKMESKEQKELSAIVTKISKQFKDTYANHIDSVDIALFGRMLANTPTMKIDAACQVAHAISTNTISMDFDYFTAVDDLNPEGETGAGMIGSTAFNSACYYRYSVIDSDQLMHNLGNKKELAKEGILGFIEGSVFAVPSGKKNAFAQNVQPDFVMVVIRENDAPANLANAFEKPANPDNKKSLSENSIKKLAKHWKNLNTMYGFENNLVAVACTSLNQLGALSANGNITGSLKDVIAATEEYLNANIREA